jgi:hypothetical protein
MNILIKIWRRAQRAVAVGSSAVLGARLNDKNMNNHKPNIALALTPNDEWRTRYQTRLKSLLPKADAESLDSDNDLAMQCRIDGETPEQAAKYVADEIMAWSAPNNPKLSHGANNCKCEFAAKCKTKEQPPLAPARC